MADFDPSSAVLADPEEAQTPQTTQATPAPTSPSDGVSDFDPASAIEVAAGQSDEPAPIPGWTPGIGSLWDHGTPPPVETPPGTFLGDVGATFNNKFNDLFGYGIPQTYWDLATGLTGNPTDAQKAALYAQAIQQREAEENPVQGKRSWGQFTGNLLASLGLTSMFPGSFSGQLLGQTGLAGLSPLEPNESRLGAMYGSALSNLLNPLSYIGLGSKLGAQPFYAPATEDVSRLTNAGIPLDTAQATGSKLAQTLKRYLVDNPLFGNSDFESKVQLPASTKAVTNMISPGAKSPQDIENAAEATFNRVYGRNPIDLNDKTAITTPQRLYGNTSVPQPNIKLGSGEAVDINSVHNPNAPLSFKQGLNVIWNRADQESSAQGGLAPVKNIITQLRASARSNDGVIPTNVAQSMRSEISQLARNSDPKVRELGGQLGELFDNTLAAQETHAGDAADLFNARQQYNAVQPVEAAMFKNAKAGGGAEAGLPALHKALTTAKDQNSVLYGSSNPIRQDLMDLAASGSRVLPEKMGNSGTAARLMGPLLTLGGTDAAMRLIETGHPGYLAAIAGIGGALPLYSRYALYNALPRATANSAFINALIGAANRTSLAASAARNQ